MNLIPEPTTATTDTSSESNLAFCVRVFGTITLSGETLTCFRCAATSPWLLFARRGDAFATCVCGCRNVHPGITADRVEDLVDGAEGMWPSVDDAERGLGFGVEPAQQGDHHDG